MLFTKKIDTNKKESLRSRIKKSFHPLDERGEMMMDSIIKIILVIVIAGIFLTGVIALIRNVAMPKMEQKVEDFFDTSSVDYIDIGDCIINIPV